MTRTKPWSIEVLIVAFRNEATIERAIGSLVLVGTPISVAVHDNSPDGATLPLAQKVCERVGYSFRGEHCRDNCGYGRGINSLATSSAAEVLLVLNPDAAIKQWRSPRLPVGREVIGPTVYDPDGSLVISWGPRRTLLEEALLKTPIVARLNRRRLARMDRGSQLGFLSGVAFLIQRAFFAELGGFDERYFLYYEDVDLTARALERGGRLVVSKEWGITHIEGHSWGENSYEQLWTAYRAGRQFFADRRQARAYDALSALNAGLRWAAYSMLTRSPQQAGDHRRLAMAISKSCGSPLSSMPQAQSRRKPARWMS